MARSFERRRGLLAVLALGLMSWVSPLAPVRGRPDAAPADEGTYEREVAPILRERCIACHNHTTRKGGLDLERYEGLVSGGRRGTTIVAGRSGESLLLKAIDGRMQPRMPLGETLPEAEIEVIRRWIDAGARGPVVAPVATAVEDSTSRAARALPPLAPTKSGRGAVGSLAVSGDGATIAVGRYREVELLDGRSGRVRRVLTGFGEQVRGTVFSPDGRLLVAVGGSPGRFGEVQVREVATGAEVRAWRGHRDNITAVVFSPDGRLVATASYDKLIRIWEVATGAEVRVLKDHTDAIFALAWSRDGRFLASGSADRTVKIWDPATGQRLSTLGDALDAVNTLAFDPGGRLVAGAGADRIIHLWRIGENGDGRQVRSLIAHEDAIVAVAFSPDGKALASSAADRSLKLWEVATLTETRNCERQPDWAQALLFTPDGRRLIAGRFDGSLGFYDPQTGRAQ